MLDLIRLETSQTETIGILKWKDIIQGFILEPPMLQNKPNKGCIPPGRYKYKKYYSSKYGCTCLALYSVPDRDYICMHPGNTFHDTAGCLLPGEYLGWMGPARAVNKSRDTMSKIIDLIDKEGWLLIKEEL